MPRCARPFAVLTVSFVVGIGSLLAACSGQNPYQAAESANSASTTVPSALAPDGTSNIGSNDFLPDANASSCIGAVERPDCGSKSKGGWRMYLTFAVLISGMSFVGWRVVRSVRQRDAVVNDIDEGTPVP